MGSLQHWNYMMWRKKNSFHHFVSPKDANILSHSDEPKMPVSAGVLAKHSPSSWNTLHPWKEAEDQPPPSCPSQMPPGPKTFPAPELCGWGQSRVQGLLLPWSWLQPAPRAFTRALAWSCSDPSPLIPFNPALWCWDRKYLSAVLTICLICREDNILCSTYFPNESPCPTFNLLDAMILLFFFKFLYKI